MVSRVKERAEPAFFIVDVVLERLWPRAEPDCSNALYNRDN